MQEQDKLFELNDTYKYETYFKEVQSNKDNIRAKIKQQLQTLKDNKIIKFKDGELYDTLD